MTSVSRSASPKASRSAAPRRRVISGRSSWTYALLAPFLLFFTLPLYWMLITAFKQDQDLYDLSAFPLWYSMAPTLEHFDYLFQDTLFPQWALNSAIIAVVVTAITLALSIPAAYALARFKMRGAKYFTIGIFLAYLLPPTLLFLPLSQVVVFLGLQDSIWSLIVMGPTRTVPFAVWLLLGYFRTLPGELEEAARVDGCNRFTALVRIILPISIPGVLTTVFFTVALTIQEFVYPLTFISSSSSRPVSIGVATDLVRGDVFFWQSLTAGALLVGLPVALAYAFFMDKFVQGITAGAIK